MKYSLRTLTIVVTLAALTSGAAAAWRGHRQFCLEREEFHASKTSPVIAGMNRFRPETEEWEVEAYRLSEKRKREKEEHARLKMEYRAAIWLPWLRLSINDPFIP